MGRLFQQDNFDEASVNAAAASGAVNNPFSASSQIDAGNSGRIGIVSKYNPSAFNYANDEEYARLQSAINNQDIATVRGLVDELDKRSIVANGSTRFETQSPTDRILNRDPVEIPKPENFNRDIASISSDLNNFIDTRQNLSPLEIEFSNTINDSRISNQQKARAEIAFRDSDLQAFDSIRKNIDDENPGGLAGFLNSAIQSSGIESAFDAAESLISGDQKIVDAENDIARRISDVQVKLEKKEITKQQADDEKRILNAELQDVYGSFLEDTSFAGFEGGLANNLLTAGGTAIQGTSEVGIVGTGVKATKAGSKLLNSSKIGLVEGAGEGLGSALATSDRNLNDVIASTFVGAGVGVTAGAGLYAGGKLVKRTANLPTKGVTAHNVLSTTGKAPGEQLSGDVQDSIAREISNNGAVGTTITGDTQASLNNINASVARGTDANINAMNRVANVPFRVAGRGVAATRELLSPIINKATDTKLGGALSKINRTNFVAENDSFIKILKDAGVSDAEASFTDAAFSSLRRTSTVSDAFLNESASVQHITNVHNEAIRSGVRAGISAEDVSQSIFNGVNAEVQIQRLKDGAQRINVDQGAVDASIKALKKELKEKGKTLTKKEKDNILEAAQESANAEGIAKMTTLIEAIDPDTKKFLPEYIAGLKGAYRELLEVMLDSGVITQQKFNQLLQNTDYIQIMRNLEQYNQTGKMDFVKGRGAPIRKISNIDLDILDEGFVNPSQVLRDATERTFDKALREEAKKRFLLTLGGTDVVEIAGKSTKALRDKYGQPLKVSTREGDKYVTKNIFVKDSELGDEIKALIKEDLPQIYDMSIGAATNVARQINAAARFGQTVGNPAFQIPNYIRDFGIAGITSEAGLRAYSPVTAAESLLSQVGVSRNNFQEIVDNWNLLDNRNTEIREYAKDPTKASAALERQLQDRFGLLDEIGILEGGGFKSALRVSARRAKNRAEAISGGLENAGRTNVFVQSYRKFKRQGLDDFNATELARQEARRATVDFQRAGKVGYVMNMFVKYSNAAIQGVDRVLESFKKNPAAFTAKTTALVGAPTIANMVYMKSHPNTRLIYDSVPQWVKDSNWLVVIDPENAGYDPETKKYFGVKRIPKPLGLTWFINPLERTMDFATRTDAPGEGNKVLYGLDQYFFGEGATPVASLASEVTPFDFTNLKKFGASTIGALPILDSASKIIYGEDLFTESELKSDADLFESTADNFKPEPTSATLSFLSGTPGFGNSERLVRAVLNDRFGELSLNAVNASDNLVNLFTDEETAVGGRSLLTSTARRFTLEDIQPQTLRDFREVVNSANDSLSVVKSNINAALAKDDKKEAIRLQKEYTDLFVKELKSVTKGLDTENLTDVINLLPENSRSYYTNTIEQVAGLALPDELEGRAGNVLYYSDRARGKERIKEVFNVELSKLSDDAKFAQGFTRADRALANIEKELADNEDFQKLKDVRSALYKTQDYDGADVYERQLNAISLPVIEKILKDTPGIKSNPIAYGSLLDQLAIGNFVYVTDSVWSAGNNGFGKTNDNQETLPLNFLENTFGKPDFSLLDN